MAFGTHHGHALYHRVTMVSILVFLEWPLGLSTFVLALTTGGFQSLFFWNGLWDGCFGPWNPGCIKFQSLFFWNGLWDVDLGYGREGRQEVSILVFLEWPLGRQLFVPLATKTIGFNPCFSGMAFGTMIYEDRRHEENKFQSLFFWNGLWDKTAMLAGDRGNSVSILVFLEWPLGHKGLSDAGEKATVFQSLFFWNGLWDTIDKFEPGMVKYRFNPCFSGMAFGTPKGSHWK